MPAAPAAPVRKKCTGQEPQVKAESLRPSLREWFYGLYVVSPVTGLFCHRRLATIVARLNTSVGAPGPHDFAVRVSVARQSTPPASIAPRTQRP